MCRDPGNDYDIDGRGPLHKRILVGDRGAEIMTSYRRAGWCAMRSTTASSSVLLRCGRTACVCLHEGYHVDLPVYRRVVTDTVFGEEVHYHELAASSGWKRSDARDVSDWYEDQRAASTDGIQLRP